MFVKLSADEIRSIANFLTINDIINFTNSNKIINIAIDNNFYNDLANKLYGNTFWKLAFNRPRVISKPLFNYKKELLRIENFQKGLDKINTKRWVAKDFYDYWKSDSKRALYLLRNTNYIY